MGAIKITDIKDLMELLPEILNYIVPGYIFITLYNFICSKPYRYDKGRIVPSVILSYLVKKVLWLFSLTDNNAVLFVSILISIVLGIVIPKLLSMPKLQRLLILCFGRTTNENIWDDIIYDDVQFRFFLINYENVIEGQIKYYEENTHDPYFEVTHYRILNSKCTEILKDYNPFHKDNDLKGVKERTIIISASNIKRIEKFVV